MRKMTKEDSSEKGPKVDMPIDALLRGIVKNTAMKVWEQERKNSPEAMRLIGERFLRSSKAENETTNEEHIAALKICMENMPWRNREFFERHYQNGVSLEQIGRENNIKPSTLRQSFCRMRSKLRDCIESKLRKKRD